LSSDVKIKIRVSKPFMRYFSTPLQDTLYYPDSSYYVIDESLQFNNKYPAYSFDMKGMAASQDDIAKATSDLDLINVVPNPYYAYSAYETDQLDNRVKITNLPQKCIITIYNMSGTMIRQFSKDDAMTSLDWDLKNHAGIPIGSGIYLIHVKADGIGERVLKWFGSLRAPDYNAF
ncbi:MAG: T9SS type A sorting domain-containing protein, partial [Bacteroidales bacterium]|nr:T9SS type A sorting domain-containing protein [Bacteroidales bacterium]